jgi:hypothetical protein
MMQTAMDVEDIQGNGPVVDKRRTTYINGIKEATPKTNKTRQLFSLVTEQETKSGILHRSSSEAASSSGRRNNAQRTQKTAQNRTPATKRNHPDALGYNRQRINKQTLGHAIARGSVETL